jgi:hypothetical protein
LTNEYKNKKQTLHEHVTKSKHDEKVLPKEDSIIITTQNYKKSDYSEQDRDVFKTTKNYNTNMIEKLTLQNIKTSLRHKS